MLNARFENATEFSISENNFPILCRRLAQAGFYLTYTASVEQDGIYILGDPSIGEQPKQIKSVLRTTLHPPETETLDAQIPFALIVYPKGGFNWEAWPSWGGHIIETDLADPHFDIKPGRIRLVVHGSPVPGRLNVARQLFLEIAAGLVDVVLLQRPNSLRVFREMTRTKKVFHALSTDIINSVNLIRMKTKGMDCQELVQNCFVLASEFGQRAVRYLEQSRWKEHNLTLMRLSMNWVSFICEDCVATDKKTFKWAVVALEFLTHMMRGRNVLVPSATEFDYVAERVSKSMTVLVSHFDIMGARSTQAALLEKEKSDVERFQRDPKRMANGTFGLDDQEAFEFRRAEMIEQLNELDELRNITQEGQEAIGRVLDDKNQDMWALVDLAASSLNIPRRWQQGKFVGGGTFGNVYQAVNLDSAEIMAVKEIRISDPKLMTPAMKSIKEEMTVLEMLDHPNVVKYYGIEVHRDKVYIFMEYCEGGSLANLLEHGRIADETVIQVYAWEMLQGLAYLHEKGVVHRDVKPESMSIGITLTQIYFSMELVISNSPILVRQKCLRDRARPKLVSQWPGPILTV
jgi:mitogen-activated protein kinase kinase kinase